MSKKICPACGSNQTSHFSERLNSTVELVIIPIGILTNRLGIQPILNRLAELIIRTITRILILLNLAHYDSDIKRVISPRAQVLWQEANQRQITMAVLIVGNQSTDNYRAKIGKATIYFTGLPRFQETPALMWVDDKARLKNFLLATGLPTVRGISSNDYQKILDCFRTLTKPVIIKPRLGSRGRHTSLFITTETDLKIAYQLARQLCPYIIIEEQLSGAVYRATVINGQLVGVLKGDQPQVTGDGEKNIKQLIDAMNQSRPSGVQEFIITDTSQKFLARQQVTLDTILSLGRKIILSEKIGVAYGGRSEEVTKITHPKIFEIMARAAQTIGDPVLGFDFIIPDITKSPDNQKWGIIECNGLPFINLHHNPLIGEPNNIARHVWASLERKLLVE